MKPDFWVQRMKFCGKVNGNKDPGGGCKRAAKQASEYYGHQHSIFCRRQESFLHLIFKDQSFYFLRTIAPGHTQLQREKKYLSAERVIHSLILTYKAIKTRRMEGKEFVYNIFLK